MCDILKEFKLKNEVECLNLYQDKFIDRKVNEGIVLIYTTRDARNDEWPDHSTSELVESWWRPRSVGDIGSETEQGPGPTQWMPDGNVAARGGRTWCSMGVQTCTDHWGRALGSPRECWPPLIISDLHFLVILQRFKLRPLGSVEPLNKTSRRSHLSGTSARLTLYSSQLKPNIALRE